MVPPKIRKGTFFMVENDFPPKMAQAEARIWP